MRNDILTGITILLLLVISYLLGRVQRRKQLTENPTDTISLYNEIQAMPAKVLAAIQGSINPQKGKMAELLTYAQIRYDYDIIIPLGQPIDFIGIKRGEKIDFIEVKSGPSQALSENEKEIESLIRSGKVKFRLLTVRDQDLHQDYETDDQ